MTVQSILVNGTEFRVPLTDQLISQVKSLKSLYDAAYEDPESFDQISYEISSKISEIASVAEPRVSDGDLDGLIQEVIRIVDSKETAIQQQLAGGARKRRARKAPAMDEP